MMNVIISDSTYIRDIQNEFNKNYSHLWIDFFYPGNSSEMPTVKSVIIPPDTLAKHLIAIKGTVSINLSGTKTVVQLEKDFLEILGTKVKVMRKSGNVWVGTSYTNNWTLENQNFEGKDINLD